MFKKFASLILTVNIVTSQANAGRGDTFGDIVEGALGVSQEIRIQQLENELKELKNQVGNSNSNNSRFSIRGKTFTDNQNGYMWEKPKSNEMN